MYGNLFVCNDTCTYIVWVRIGSLESTRTNVVWVKIGSLDLTHAQTLYG